MKQAPSSPVHAHSTHADEVDALVSVSDVRMEYERSGETVVAVDKVSFGIQEHDRVMLIGPSGCGKSTILRAIAGFKPVAGGSVRLDGVPITKPGPDRAVVFQEFDQLFPWMTVRRNVAFPLRVNGASKQQSLDTADRFLEITGLIHAADRHPHELSGGMKQRVAIARGLALAPKVLLMDEPFGALDAITRNRLQSELKRIATEQGTTILFVTHSIPEAVALGTSVVVLTGGPSVVAEHLRIEPGDVQSPLRRDEIQQHLHSLIAGSATEVGNDVVLD